MPKILIIDDDADIVEAIKIVLESKGYKVISANEGDAGYKKAETERPDLIILDVMMKTKDQGFQVSYKLKNHPELAKIPILMLTSVGRETGFQFSKETDEEYLPVDELVEKPIKPKELLAKVEKLLKSSGTESRPAGRRARP
ncbi:MAG: response regulator [Deltaproteobacteria bacterium]|nr:response regulator [Deltaproteobacteria bacterium]